MDSSFLKKLLESQVLGRYFFWEQFFFEIFTHTCFREAPLNFYALYLLIGWTYNDVDRVRYMFLYPENLHQSGGLIIAFNRKIRLSDTVLMDSCQSKIARNGRIQGLFIFRESHKSRLVIFPCSPYFSKSWPESRNTKERILGFRNLWTAEEIKNGIRAVAGSVFADAPSSSIFGIRASTEGLQTIYPRSQNFRRYSLGKSSQPFFGESGRPFFCSPTCSIFCELPTPFFDASPKHQGTKRDHRFYGKSGRL